MTGVIKKLFFCLLFIIPSILQGQEKAEIVYAQGEGFTLVREGKSVYYDLYEEPAEGMVLWPGDVILTEQDSWMEIEINGTGSLIKIAENTTFSIDSLENRGGTFGVSYGRIRAKVEKLTDDSPFWIQGVDTVAGVRGTDFGYDLFFNREKPGKARTDVYCFQGKVEVVKLETREETEGEALDTETRPQSVILGRNEMVSVYSDSDETLGKERVSAELKEFWGENDFQYEPVKESLAPVVALTGFYDDSRHLKQAALFSGITGGLIAGTGLAAYYLADGSSTFVIGMGGVGSVFLTGACCFLIRSLILDHKNEKTTAVEGNL